MVATSRRGADLRIVAGSVPRRPFLAFCGALLIALILAAMLGSQPMLDWVQSLPDGWLADDLTPPITAWNNAMQTIGMGHFNEVLHNSFQNFAAAKFPGAEQ